MALSPKSNSKIWLTFIIILIVVGAAIFWSFQSYKKLNNSIDSLTEPDHKSALIQNTIQGIQKPKSTFNRTFLLMTQISIRTIEMK